MKCKVKAKVGGKSRNVFQKQDTAFTELVMV